MAAGGRPSMMVFLVFVGTILVLVGAHELGHFLAAKLLRVGVLEFAIGFGPAIWTWRRGKTRYSLRLFPFGGYVRLAQEDLEVGDYSLEETYYGRPAWVRFLVALSGPVFNVLLALILAFSGFLFIGLPRLRVAGLTPGKPAENALQIGDIILAIEGKPVWSTEEIREIIQARAPESLRFHILREGKELEITIIPVYSEQDGRYLVGGIFGPQVILAEIQELQPLSPLSAIGLREGDVIIAACARPIRSLLEWYDALRQECRLIQVQRGEQILDFEITVNVEKLFQDVKFKTLPVVYGRIGANQAGILATHQVGLAFSGIVETLKALVRGEIPAGEAVAGPVGIAGLIAAKMAAGALVLILLITVLSVNVAFFNLLPIPALDGARMIFALVELLTRRRVPAKVETFVHAVGIILVLGLLVLLVVRDIFRLFG